MEEKDILRLQSDFDDELPTLKEELADEDEDTLPSDYIPYGTKEIITDETEIRYSKASLFQIALSNKLLGNFNSIGDYVLDTDIAEELIELPKKLDERIGKVAYADAEVQGQFLRFKVEFSEGGGQSDAKLFLIERIKDGFEFESIETYLSMFTLASESGFMDKAYLEFNINAEVTPFEIESYKSLKAKMDAMAEEYGYNMMLLGLLSQDYVGRLKALLEKLGGKGGKILEEYNAVLAQLLEQNKIALNDFAAYKNLLDSIMRKHDGFSFILKEASVEAINILDSISSTIERIQKDDFKGVLAAGGAATAEKEKESAKKNEEIKTKKPSAPKAKAEKKKAAVKPEVKSKYNIVPPLLADSRAIPQGARTLAPRTNKTQEANTKYTSTETQTSENVFNEVLGVSIDSLFNCFDAQREAAEHQVNAVSEKNSITIKTATSEATSVESLGDNRKLFQDTNSLGLGLGK